METKTEPAGPSAPQVKQDPQMVRVALTVGSTPWVDFFEKSVARTLSHIIHIPLFDSRYRMPRVLYDKLFQAGDEDGYRRICQAPKQASELLYRISTLAKVADVAFVDVSALDTALGHQVLVSASQALLPVYGVGFDDRLSPLAPAFLRGVVYPATADDLVTLVMQAYRTGGPENA